MTNDKIPKGHKANFETLKAAFANGDVALMQCRRKHVTLALEDEEALYLENILQARIKKHERPVAEADLFNETQRANRLAAERSMVEKLNHGEKERVTVICMVNRIEGEYQFVPAAQLFNDNPYDLLEPPAPGGGFEQG